MLNLNRELLNCTHASVERQSAQKLVQRKFELSTTISINKVENSIEMPFCYMHCRTRVLCIICTCAYQKFSTLVPSHEINEIMLHNFFPFHATQSGLSTPKVTKKEKLGKIRRFDYSGVPNKRGAPITVQIGGFLKN